jgi:hypothetical protein
MSCESSKPKIFKPGDLVKLVHFRPPNPPFLEKNFCWAVLKYRKNLTNLPVAVEHHNYTSIIIVGDSVKVSDLEIPSQYYILPKDLTLYPSLYFTVGGDTLEMWLEKEALIHVI